ncbi:hypothetical protein LG198_08605 [Methylobacillus arboreus]|nr:hypothetical protein [Methylobacillus arboreus]
MSWAVAGAYCAHEHGTAAQHFGHHDHEHHGDEADLSSAGVDRDCGYHQQSTPQWLPSVSLVTTLFTEVHHLFSPTLSLLPDSLLERPERPKWHPAA